MPEIKTLGIYIFYFYKDVQQFYNNIKKNPPTPSNIRPLQITVEPIYTIKHLSVTTLRCHISSSQKSMLEKHFITWYVSKINTCDFSESVDLEICTYLFLLALWANSTHIAFCSSTSQLNSLHCLKLEVKSSNFLVKCNNKTSISA